MFDMRHDISNIASYEHVSRIGLCKSGWKHPWVYTSHENGRWFWIFIDMMKPWNHILLIFVSVLQNTSEYFFNSFQIHLRPHISGFQLLWKINEKHFAFFKPTNQGLSKDFHNKIEIIFILIYFSLTLMRVWMAESRKLWNILWKFSCKRNWCVEGVRSHSPVYLACHFI